MNRLVTQNFSWDFSQVAKKNKILSKCQIKFTKCVKLMGLVF